MLHRVDAQPEPIADLLRARLQNAALLGLAFMVLTYALFPGKFDADSAWMYAQAYDLHVVSDAHSPLLTFAMAVSRDITEGPALLFVLQLAGWIFGLWLFSDTLIAAGYPSAGMLSVLGCLTPLVSYIFLDVNKDTGMAALGTLLVGRLTRIALLGWRPTLYSYLGLGLLAVAFLGLRHNALFALAPLVLVFVVHWPKMRRGWRSALLVASAMLLVLTAADHWVKYHALAAQRAWGVRALVMFDLAGITSYSGQDASSGLFGANFHARAAACYTPKWHDPFEWGPCRDYGATLAQLAQTDGGRLRMYKAWADAVVGHPFSYLRHRLAYYNQLMQFACRDCETPMTTGAIWSRPWEPPPRRLTSLEVLLDAVANGFYRSPLGRGWVWMLVLIACNATLALLLRRTRERPLPLLGLGIGASAQLYALALFAIGIAYPSRYLHWTVMLGILTLTLTGAAMLQYLRRNKLDEDGVERVVVLTGQPIRAERGGRPRASRTGGGAELS